jgi:hypothetical protein
VKPGGKPEPGPRMSAFAESIEGRKRERRILVNVITRPEVNAFQSATRPLPGSSVISVATLFARLSQRHAKCD